MARGFPRDKKIYTLLLLGYNGKTLLTAKMPKNTQKLRFWFLGGFLINYAATENR
jgi:hypothetical protein